MSAPLICITTHRVAPESRDQLEALLEEYTELLAEQEPDLIAHYAYFDESGAELSLVQVQRNTAAAEHHMEVAGALIGEGVALSAPVRLQVYGEPGPRLTRAFETNEDLGAEILVARRPDRGFTRAAEPDGVTGGGIRS